MLLIRCTESKGRQEESSQNCWDGNQTTEIISVRNGRFCLSKVLLLVSVYLTYVNRIAEIKFRPVIYVTYTLSYNMTVYRPKLDVIKLALQIALSFCCLHETAMLMSLYSMSTCQLLYRVDLEQLKTEKAQLLRELNQCSSEMEELKKRYI